MGKTYALEICLLWDCYIPHFGYFDAHKMIQTFSSHIFHFDNYGNRHHQAKYYTTTEKLLIVQSTKYYHQKQDYYCMLRTIKFSMVMWIIYILMILEKAELQGILFI